MFSLYIYLVLQILTFYLYIWSNFRYLIKTHLELYYFWYKGGSIFWSCLGAFRVDSLLNPVGALLNISSERINSLLILEMN